MKITIIGNNYYPEDSGIGLYTTELAEFLAKKNIDINIITAYPYYPKWEINESYKNKGHFLKERINNVTVNRVRIFVPKKPNSFSRVIQMLHFFILSMFKIRAVKNTDVIIAIVPFTVNIIFAYFVKKIYKSKVIIHTQDFEFDAAFETGILKNKTLKLILQTIENKLYNIADLNSTISFGMMDKLAEKKLVNNYYFPNWIDSSMINPAIATKSNLFNEKKFNILYSGNIGQKQDWDLFISLVDIFKNNTQIQFTLVGEGASKDEVIAKILNRKNVTYHKPVLYSELNDLLCNADLHVLFQKNAVADSVMPSKILGMMASAKPSIVTGHKNSEVRQVFEKSEGGFYFINTDYDQIINKITELFENKNLSNETGLKARKYIIDKFSKDRILNDFIKTLSTL